VKKGCIDWLILKTTKAHAPAVVENTNVLWH